VSNFKNIISCVRGWVRERRWCDFKDVELFSVKLCWHLKLGENLFLTVMEMRTRERRSLYYLPLLVENSKSSKYCGKANDVFICEAEYYPDYYNQVFFILPKEPNSELRVHLYSRLSPSTTMEPIAGSTNPVVKIVSERKDKYILKSYRKIYKINREYIFLKKLWRRFPNVPELLAEFSHKDFGTFSIVTKYIEFLSDGGAPFVQNLIGYLEGQCDISEYLPRRLGELTAKFHNNLLDEKDPFFKPEAISKEDIMRWKNRIYSRARNLSLEVSSLIPLVDKFNGYSKLTKMQIHQDYHLAQLLYTVTNDFVVLDFEGEPGRDPRELMVKEPPARDLGCMVRSFDYLIYFTVPNYFKTSIERAHEVVIANKKVFEWRRSIIETFLASYLDNITERVLGDAADLRELGNLTLPWVLEKALYEAIYERRYRPSFLYIPLSGIQELLRGIHPMFQIIK